MHVDFYNAILATASPVTPVITFDDGHVSDFTFAAPILASHGLKAHFFITVGWTATRPGYMDWSQLRALHEFGHTIGAHGWSHTLLTRCTPARLKIELTRPRLTLEDRLGIAITTMSLPGGRANRRVIAACYDAGYKHVYTSVPRAEPMPYGFTIGRLNICGDMQPSWLSQLFTPSSRLLDRLGRNHRLKVAANSVLGDALYHRIWAMANRHEADADTPTRSDLNGGDYSSHEDPTS